MVRTLRQPKEITTMFPQMFALASDTVQRAFVGTLGTALCAGLCLAAAAGPAEAATVDAGFGRAQAVVTHDLNLSNPTGRKALDLRIRHAARTVCAIGGNDVRTLTAEARCVREAVDGAAIKTAAID